MQYYEFITAIESIYTEYKSDILKKLTGAYVKEHFQESELINVLAKLTVELHPKFKTPPSPADFEDIFFRKNDKDHEAEALHWYGLLSNTGNSLDNVAISDIRAQACIEDFGGWPAFCQRNPESEHFHQAKFLKWFVMYSYTSPERQAKVLKGESTRNKPPLIFGDKSACLKLIDIAEDNSSQAMQAIENMTKEMRITQ